MDGTLLVQARQQAKYLEPLGIQCDGRETPESRDGTKPIGWWLAAVAAFTGSTATKVLGDGLGEPREMVLQGTAAMAVYSDRILGIISPAEESTAALWWAWSLSATKVSATGELGVFRKRPANISLGNTDGSIELAGVSRLYRSSGRYQDGQEGSFIKALRRLSE